MSSQTGVPKGVMYLHTAVLATAFGTTPGCTGLSSFVIYFYNVAQSITIDILEFFTRTPKKKKKKKKNQNKKK
jgi:hypothetical protein